MKTILITGGSGLVGSFLSQKLSQKGYLIKHLSRKKPKFSQFPTYLWDIKHGFIEESALENIDAVIHLAGAPIFGKRWSEDYRHKILDSRIKSTKLLYEKISALEKKPRCFISASGSSYYGQSIYNKAFEEEDSPGGDFLANVCKEWEREATEFSNLGIRNVQIRTSIVLSKEGGALEKLTKTIKAYMGAPLGSGKQYLPWIHIEDLANLYIKALEDESWKGPYNGAAPECLTNKEFTKKLAKVLNRPILLPHVPSWALILLLGEVAHVLLGGSPLSSIKLKKNGFSFQFSKLEEALKNIYKI